MCAFMSVVVMQQCPKYKHLWDRKLVILRAPVGTGVWHTCREEHHALTSSRLTQGLYDLATKPSNCKTQRPLTLTHLIVCWWLTVSSIRKNTLPQQLFPSSKEMVTTEEPWQRLWLTITECTPDASQVSGTQTPCTPSLAPDEINPVSSIIEERTKPLVVWVTTRVWAREQETWTPSLSFPDFDFLGLL